MSQFDFRWPQRADLHLNNTLLQISVVHQHANYEFFFGYPKLGIMFTSFDLVQTIWRLTSTKDRKMWLHLILWVFGKKIKSGNCDHFSAVRLLLLHRLSNITGRKCESFSVMQFILFHYLSDTTDINKFFIARLKRFYMFTMIQRLLFKLGRCIASQCKNIRRDSFVTIASSNMSVNKWGCDKYRSC